MQTPTRPRPQRIHTPTLLQQEAVECGAAALGIVLRYYGRYHSLEELRLACGVSRDGSTAWNVIKAAESYGLQAKGLRRNDIAALGEMPLPLILFWNFNHFLVLEGFGKNVVYLNDPGTGPRTVSYEEFDESFTGIVLQLTPGPNFKREGKEPQLVGTMLKRLESSRRGMLFVLLASLGLVLVTLVVPAFLRVFVDDVLVGGRTEQLAPLLGIMALAAFLIGGFTWLQQTYLLRLEMKLSLSAASQFFWHVIRLPAEFFTQRYSGDIAFRIQINDRVAQLLSGELATNLIALLLIAIYALLMLQYDVLLTVVGIVIVLLNLAALRYVSRLRTDANRNLLQEQARLIGMSVNALEIIETLKASGSEDSLFSRWAGVQAKGTIAEQRLGRLTTLLTLVPPLLMGVSTTAILVLGGTRVLAGELSIGELVAFQSLMLAFAAPAVLFVNLGSRLQEADGDLKRLDDVLVYPIDPNTQDTAQEAESAVLEGSLELSDVTFGYSKLSPPLIENFSLSVKPGQRVALVGGSGSGKSTVSRLVAGLYQPWSGDILYDGKPRADIPRSVMNASLDMVDQNIVLFEGSIRDNLTLWDDAIPQQQIIEAAKDAEIHDIITARPGGYHFPMAAGGFNFSGGERQRLEIARALVIRPALLVLDEATSALDPVTEQQVMDNLRRRGCTCLIVAHRLSTIRDCDEIIVMDKGKIVQRGTHKQLLREGGAYAELIGAEQQDGDKSVVKSLLDQLL
jgi:NHLM bacteriocin system ABC transporter peptidase/ATP-binding protein